VKAVGVVSATSVMRDDGYNSILARRSMAILRYIAIAAKPPVIRVIGTQAVLSRRPRLQRNRFDLREVDSKFSPHPRFHVLGINRRVMLDDLPSVRKHHGDSVDAKAVVNFMDPLQARVIGAERSANRAPGRPGEFGSLVVDQKLRLVCRDFFNLHAARYHLFLELNTNAMVALLELSIDQKNRGIDIHLTVILADNNPFGEFRSDSPAVRDAQFYQRRR